MDAKANSFGTESGKDEFVIDLVDEHIAEEG